MTDLLPCPFCGSSDTYVETVAPHTHKFATFMPDYEGGAMAVCGNCHAANWRDGKDAESEIVELWNRRPDPAPVGVRVPEDVMSLLCNAADNLGDMPINEKWAADWVKRFETIFHTPELPGPLIYNPQPGAVVGELIDALIVASYNDGECQRQQYSDQVCGIRDNLLRTLTNTDKGSAT